MQRFSINVEIANHPKLDKSFIPIYAFNKAYLSGASVPLGIAIERLNGDVAVINTFVYDTDDMKKADFYYVNRLIKTHLWLKGGYKIYVSGPHDIYKAVCRDFSENGRQFFDNGFMANVYGHDFEIVYTDLLPSPKDSPKAAFKDLRGCRIGFDAGGSDRKVSAVIDGKCVYSDETIWLPKENDDPKYHYDGIVDSFKRAADHLPRVDCVGISSAGIYIDNKAKTASLFIKVPKDKKAEVESIYERAVKDTFKDIPFEVANDGDVSALAGAMSLNENNVLGIAMGTSEAVGYVDGNDRITGWLNELAFVPVDAQEDSPIDEWSGDEGCGVKYFSQDAVIRLADKAGIKLNEADTPAQKLKAVQALVEKKDKRAEDIYLTIGSYLGHTLALYYDLYECRHILLLGRVMSGRGGDIILSEAKRVMRDEYPDTMDKVSVSLPNESFRRVGQSYAAAALPKIR